MKPFVITSIVLVGLFIIVQSFVSISMSGIEKHKYTVVQEFKDFEIRQYETALFSSVILDASSYDQSSSSGFRVLAGYIFGGNAASEKIAMTSPVAMELGDKVKMSFMVPSEYTEKDLPKPTNGRIFFEKKEGKQMAAIGFGGWASDEKIEEYKKRLAGLLAKHGIQHTGNFIYLGYNPPYKLIGRKNEIIVEVNGFKK